MERYIIVSRILATHAVTFILPSGFFSMFATGRVKPVIFSEVYKLDRVVDGLAAIETRQTWGKAVVRVRDEVEQAKL